MACGPAIEDEGASVSSRPNRGRERVSKSDGLRMFRPIERSA